MSCRVMRHAGGASRHGASAAAVTLVQALLRDLNTSSLEWVQLGPAALEYLDEYAEMQTEGLVRHYGVEDYTA